jgi:hypothetical protein
MRPKQDRKEENIFGEEGSERTPMLPHRPVRAERPTACVRWAAGGRVRDCQPSTSFKKEEEEDTYNSPFDY